MFAGLAHRLDQVSRGGAVRRCRPWAGNGRGHLGPDWESRSGDVAGPASKVTVSQDDRDDTRRPMPGSDTGRRGPQITRLWWPLPV